MFPGKRRSQRTKTRRISSLNEPTNGKFNQNVEKSECREELRRDKADAALYGRFIASEVQ